MDANHVFRFLREMEARQLGISYDKLVSDEVGTDLRRVLLHTDMRTAFRMYWNNLKSKEQVDGHF